MPEADTPKPNAFAAFATAVGDRTIEGFAYIGGIAWMAVDVAYCLFRALLVRRVRLGRTAVYTQMVRLGVRAAGIVILVSMCIGLIMVLQTAPPLEDFGQTDKVANINAVAILRELGPLISAIVLTGFAGASIAAELGTMVVGEEIEALESMALDPVRFLVVPRVIASLICLMVLATMADVVALSAGAVMGVFVLEVPWDLFYANTIDQAKVSDFLSGIVKAGVFGGMIGLIACFNGLRVSGGAAGVGRATTVTVVHSIVAIIFADLLFTALFFAVGWN